MALLVKAIKITKELSKLFGCWDLIVQPKGEVEAHFYKHFGFRTCKKLEDEPPLLFFEMKNLSI